MRARADLFVDPQHLTRFVDEPAHAGGELFLGANHAELEAQLAVGIGQKSKGQAQILSKGALAMRPIRSISRNGPHPNARLLQLRVSVA